MAFFNDLVRVVAAVEGLDEVTVSGVGQYLRADGLISKSGRGRSAANMTPLDAAHLLIGVNASIKAVDAVDTVRLMAPLSVYDRQVDSEYESVLKRSIFGEVIGGRLNFAECIAHLICASGRDVGDSKSLTDVLRKISDLEKRREQYVTDRMVVVKFDKQARSGAIYLPTWDFLDPMFEIEFLMKQPGEVISGDRRDITEVTSRTLTAVGKLLAQE